VYINHIVNTWDRHGGWHVVNVQHSMMYDRCLYFGNDESYDLPKSCSSKSPVVKYDRTWAKATSRNRSQPLFSSHGRAGMFPIPFNSKTFPDILVSRSHSSS
jgi:hypothetical protein